MNKPKTKRDLSPFEIKVREAVQAVGDLLTQYLKSGALSEERRAATEQQTLMIATSILGTPQTATAEYRSECKRFLRDVIKAKGLPAASIISADAGDGLGDVVTSSGADIEKAFAQLLPSIRNRVEWCIDNFSSQAQHYLDIRVGEFRKLLNSFLLAVPAGGSKDKGIKSRITEVKREFRSLCDWESLFCVFKQTSLSAAIEQIFALQRHPIAAMWRYSSMDEESDAPRNDHRQRDQRIYVVRGNWALEKGLMQVGRYGYVDEVSMPPQQEIGCMCEYRWLYYIRDLPDDMLTDQGRSEHQHASEVVDDWMGGRKTPLAPDPPGPSAEPTSQTSPAPGHLEVQNRGIISLLLSWLKKEP